MDDRQGVTTFLFTDIEGSSALWENDPERMRLALARHDAIGRAAVEATRGVVVKTTGDGLHAAFVDPADAVAAALAIQRGLADPNETGGLSLRVRCGIHAGVIERRERDYFGDAVNRAARIMSIANGGQILVSQAVADLVRDRLPADATLRDLGTVHLRGLTAAERIHQLVHPALRSDFPALHALESTPNNLPQPLTTFVGREREIGEVRGLLHSSRLVTLCGMGGLGKTRLSLQVAAEVLDEYEDGVWFVDLAPVSDPRLVAQTVASVLAVKEDAGRPVTEALLRFVRDRTLLVVLDNCEHVVQSAAELAAGLLQAGTRIRILATSREPLRVPGESSYPVGALSVPAPGAPVDAASSERFESVRLFLDRARAVQPAFALSERNAAPVAEICRRLDGIPLAIELAAARLRVLSPEAIAARLDDVFRLLTAGDRTALPRQRTLRALIDWSHDLLSPAEQALFRRLAVFAGGWTIEAAEAVCAFAPVEHDAVLDLLAELVDKSLIAVDYEANRYRLLETVRQYAADKLATSVEEKATRQRHAEWFVEFAEKARVQLLGPEQARWLERLDSERENIFAAHATLSTSASAADADLRLVYAIKQYFHRRGLLTLAQRVMNEALEHREAGASPANRSRALFALGQICMAMGRYDEARRALEESLSIARTASDVPRIAAVLQPLAVVLTAQGQLQEARERSDEAIALARTIGVPREIATAMNNRAQLHRLEHELEKARPLYSEVLEWARAAGDLENKAIAHLNLAMTATGLGDRAAACAHLRDALGIARLTDSRPVCQSVVEVAAGLASACGDHERCAKLFGAAERMAVETECKQDAADAAFLEPLVAQARAAVPASRFEELSRSGNRLGFSDALNEVERWLGAGSDR